MPVSGLIGQSNTVPHCHTRLDTDITQFRISTLKTSASLIFAFHRFVLRQGKFWSVLQKYLKVCDWRDHGGGRCGMEMSWIISYIADVNLVPFQYTMSLYYSDLVNCGLLFIIVYSSVLCSASWCESNSCGVCLCMNVRTNKIIMIRIMTSSVFSSHLGQNQINSGR